MKTFIHHDGALGDALLSLPVLRSIRKDSAVIHFAGRTDVGVLLRECNLTDELSFSGSSRYASLYAGATADDLSAFLRTFDRAFLFTVNRTSALAAALAAVIPATRIIMTISPEPDHVHASDFRIHQLKDAGLPVDRPLLSVPRQYRDMAVAMLRRSGYDGSAPVVAVHPGSGSSLKSWPLDRFFEVVDRLQASSDPFAVLLTGPAEGDALKEQVEEFSRKRGAAHVADGDLISVAAVLSGCELFLGNDSGIGHLAAAVGCPVVSLFGSTDPEIWAPRGSRVEVIRNQTLADIDADRVYSRATAMLQAGGK